MRPLMETVSGRVIDLVNPSAEMIDLGDITYALSNICRYGGHTREFYSVAEHSVVVHDLVKLMGGDENAQVGALLHDAHEAYLCDIPSPLKLLFAEYDRLAARMNEAIADVANIDVALLSTGLVRDCDTWALHMEANALMHKGNSANWPGRDVARYQSVPDDIFWDLGLPPMVASNVFRNRLHQHGLDEA